jgi:thiol:disulfide interchange protein DsbD
MFLLNHLSINLKFIQRWVYALVALLLLFTSNPLLGDTKPTPLAADQAFTFSASATNSQMIVLHWTLAPTYYLYRDRISFKPQDPDQVQLGQPIFPTSVTKQNPEVGNFKVYQNEVEIPIPVIKPTGGNVNLLVTYQGCSEAGFCYPPITKSVTLNLSGNYNQATAGTSVTSSSLAPTSHAHPYVSSQERVSQILAGGNLIWIILSCIGFGLLLSFTPCVLPIIPILSGIILGHDSPVSTAKAFRLSLVYVLSMSLTYAIAGLLIGWLGSNLQVVLQKPWVIVLFSLVFISLALSLFGLYDLHLPKGLQTRISNISHHQKSGHYIGVAIMGCLATLIVSPCVTPPLVGILSYIGHKGSPLLGGIALFSLGIGMGIPLVLIGTSGGKLVPKTGHWMNNIKSVLGVMMLGVAIWMLQRILPGSIILLLWAALFIICAIYLGALSTTTNGGWEKLWRGIGFLMLIYGVLLIFGAARGNGDPLKPLAISPFSSELHAATADLPFQPIKTVAELQEALTSAKQHNRSVLLDFYADWCTACKIMAKQTFADPRVQKALNNFILLQVDMTDNNENNHALLQQLGIVAPPTVLFYSPAGEELSHLRVVGEMEPDQFLKVIQEVS